MSRRSSRRQTSQPAFPALRPGIQAGLKRLVSDNSATVARMLQCESSDTDVLCEKCASVMKQQQLSASSFLARFFDAEMLKQHALLLGKSGKGSPAVLSERIEAEWSKNRMPAAASTNTAATTATIPEAKTDRKRPAEESVPSSDDAVSRRKPRKPPAAAAAAAPSVVFEASLKPANKDVVQVSSSHETTAEAVQVAWDFCDDHGLGMPSSDWYVDTKYGEQECYNVMVPKGEWEPEEVFVRFMNAHVKKKGEVELTSGESYIRITKECPSGNEE